jgi:hypothetical protein
MLLRAVLLRSVLSPALFYLEDADSIGGNVVYYCIVPSPRNKVILALNCHESLKSSRI